MSSLPSSVKYLVIGAGIHGLSTAYHLALALEKSGKGSGKDVIVLEKSRLGAGASGIACGVVRNFYFSPGLAEVIRVSVELFETDPAGFGYHPVGYIAAVPEIQAEDCVAIQQRQAEIGYRSDVVLGEQACTEHMRAIFPDWNGEGIEAVLHERQGGWAETMKTVENLAKLAGSKGVRIFEGVEVTGIDLHDGRVDSVETSAGSIRTETPRSDRTGVRLRPQVSISSPTSIGSDDSLTGLAKSRISATERSSRASSSSAMSRCSRSSSGSCSLRRRIWTFIEMLVSGVRMSCAIAAANWPSAASRRASSSSDTAWARWTASATRAARSRATT